MNDGTRPTRTRNAVSDGIPSSERPNREGLRPNVDGLYPEVKTSASIARRGSEQSEHSSNNKNTIWNFIRYFMSITNMSHSTPSSVLPDASGGSLGDEQCLSSKSKSAMSKYPEGPNTVSHARSVDIQRDVPGVDHTRLTGIKLYILFAAVLFSTFLMALNGSIVSTVRPIYTSY